MTTEEKILHFQEHAMLSARQQSTQEVELFTKTLKQEYEAHCRDVSRQLKLHARMEAEKQEHEQNKTISQESVRIRHELNAFHRTLADRMYQEVKVLIDDYRTRPEYKKFLLALIRKANRIAGRSTVILYISPEDKELKNELEAACGSLLKVSDTSFLGGLKALIPERSLSINHAFSDELQRIMESYVIGGNHG